MSDKPFFEQVADVEALLKEANEPAEPERPVVERKPADVPPTDRTRINLARENRRIT